MLTKVQEQLLVLLKEIDEICTKHNIEYYLGGGCLIGAVRNGGFLPWDDDLDIHMTRENAMKFLSLENELPKDRSISCLEKDIGISQFWWRYQDDSKTASMRSSFISSVARGQFVDIFTLEEAPDDEEEQKLFLENSNLMCELVHWMAVADAFRSRDFLRKYKALTEREHENSNSIKEKLLDELYPYPKLQNTNHYLVRSLAFIEITPKDIWGKPRKVVFEGMMAPIPEKAEELFLFAYGSDWMNIPLDKERGFHVIVHDQDIPYSVYDKEIAKSLDMEKTQRQVKYKKDYAMFKFLPDRNYVNPKCLLLNGPIVNKKISEKLSHDKLSVKDLVKSLNINKLKYIFEDYYSVQFQGPFKYYGLFLEIPDVWLFAAMIPVLYAGEYEKVYKVIELRCGYKEAKLNRDLQSLKTVASAIRDIINCLYVFYDYDKAEKILKRSIKKWWWAINLQRAEVRLCIINSNYNEAELKLDRYLERYPFDGELLKYYGDICLEKGDIEGCIKNYTKAHSFVRNGLIKHEIEQFLLSHEKNTENDNNN